MIPKIIHQTSKSKELTWEEARLAKRLRAVLRDWRYNLWDDEDNQSLFDEYLPEHSSAFRNIETGVVKADLARYLYLYVFGGFYFDTDYKILRAIGPDILEQECVLPIEHDRIAGSARSAQAPVIGLGNAVMGSAPGFPLWRDLISQIFKDMKSRTAHAEEQVVAVSGPEALSRFYHANQRRYPNVLTPSRNLFFPDIALLALKTSADRHTYGVHLCWGSWRGRPFLTALRKVARRKLNAF